MGRIAGRARSAIDGHAAGAKRIEQLEQATAGTGLLAEDDGAPGRTVCWIAGHVAGHDVLDDAVREAHPLQGGGAGSPTVHFVAHDGPRRVGVVRPQRDHVGVLADPVGHERHGQTLGRLDGSGPGCRRRAGGCMVQWLAEAEQPVRLRSQPMLDIHALVTVADGPCRAASDRHQREGRDQGGAPMRAARPHPIHQAMPPLARAREPRVRPITAPAEPARVR